MLVIQVPNSSGLSVPTAPKLVIPAYEKAVMASGAVASVIDPATNPPANSYVRARVGSATWRHGGTIEARAELNNQQGVVLPTAVASLGVTSPFAPAEYTLICPVRVTADGYLLGVGSHRVRSVGTTLECKLAHNAAMALAAPLGSPSVGTTRLLAWSWSSAARTMAMMINGASAGVSAVQATDTSAAYPVGGVFAYNSAADGAAAIFGDIVVLAKAAHIDPRPTMAVLAAMSSKYGIPLGV